MLFSPELDAMKAQMTAIILRETLESRNTTFLISDANGFVYFGKKDFSVSYFSARCALEDGIDHRVDEVIG